jgi:hypothetical protein
MPLVVNDVVPLELEDQKDEECVIQERFVYREGSEEVRR